VRTTTEAALGDGVWSTRDGSQEEVAGVYRAELRVAACHGAAAEVSEAGHDEAAERGELDRGGRAVEDYAELLRLECNEVRESQECGVVGG
jgi:hypothetical protein